MKKEELDISKGHVLIQEGQFNEESYVPSDKFSRHVFIPFLKHNGYNIIKDYEDKNHDIEAVSPYGEYGYFELETKAEWFTIKDTYPYKKTVSFLRRKIRLYDMNEFYYVIVGLQSKWGIVCPSNIVFQEQYEVNINLKSPRTKGELRVYHVPIKYCTFIDLNVPGNADIHYQDYFKN